MLVLPVTPSEICDVIATFKFNKSACYDSNSPYVIKSIIKNIALSLGDVFHKSLLTGCFPDKLKVAKVIPFYKGDNKRLLNNYSSISVLENLFKLQKKAVRVITWSKWNSHSSPIFKQLNILNLFVINLVQVTCFVYRSLNGQLSPMFKDYFVQNCTVHNHITRHCLNLQLPLHRTNIRANSIRVSGVNFGTRLALK